KNRRKRHERKHARESRCSGHVRPPSAGACVVSRSRCRPAGAPPACVSSSNSRSSDNRCHGPALPPGPAPCLTAGSSRLDSLALAVLAAACGLYAHLVAFLVRERLLLATRAHGMRHAHGDIIVFREAVGLESGL